MRTTIKTMLLVAGLTFPLTACTVEQTREAELPDVDVEGGQMPKFDVKVADVDVKGRKVNVPVPDVDVKMKEKQVTVPDVDVKWKDVDVDTEQKEVDVPKVTTEKKTVPVPDVDVEG